MIQSLRKAKFSWPGHSVCNFAVAVAGDADEPGGGGRCSCFPGTLSSLFSYPDVRRRLQTMGVWIRAGGLPNWELSHLQRATLQASFDISVRFLPPQTVVPEGLTVWATPALPKYLHVESFSDIWRTEKKKTHRGYLYKKLGHEI